MTAPLCALSAAFTLLASTGAAGSVAEEGAKRAGNPPSIEGRELDLAGMLRLCADESGVHFVLPLPTAARLERTPVPLPAGIGREQLLSWAGIQLFCNDLNDLASVEVGPYGPSLRVVRAAPLPLPRCLDFAWLRGRLDALPRPDARATVHR